MVMPLLALAVAVATSLAAAEGQPAPVVADVALPGKALSAPAWAPEGDRIHLGVACDSGDCVATLTLAGGTLACGGTFSAGPHDLATLAGGRVLVRSKEGLRDRDGALVVPGGQRAVPSPDGRWVACNVVDGGFRCELRSADGAAVRALEPVPLPSGSDGVPAVQAMHWEDATRLRVIRGRGYRLGGARGSEHLVDVVSGAEVPAAELLLEPGSDIRNDRAQQARAWLIPGGGRLRIVRDAGASEHLPATEGPDVPAPPARGLELVASDGTVVARPALAIDGCDLRPLRLSSDGRWMLAEICRWWRHVRGAPQSIWRPVVERVLLIELATARIVRELTLPAAVLESPRDLLLLGNAPVLLCGLEEHPSANHPGDGLWRLDDAVPPLDLAGEAGLPRGWAAEPPRAYPALWCAERLAVVTRPYRRIDLEGVRSIVVVSGSPATATVAWSSQGREDGPDQLAWSPSGRHLAFIAGGRLRVLAIP